MKHQDEIKLIKDELNHFICLAEAQSAQLKKYAELQRRSHTLINTLLQRLKSEGVDEA